MGSMFVFMGGIMGVGSPGSARTDRVFGTDSSVLIKDNSEEEVVRMVDKY